MKRKIILSVAAFILAGLILAPLGLTLFFEYWYLYLIVALAVGVFTFFVLSFHYKNVLSIQEAQEQAINDVLLKVDSLKGDLKAIGNNLQAVMEKNRQDILKGIAENLMALKETSEFVSDAIKKAGTSTDELIKSAVNSVNGKFDEAFDKSDKGITLLQENLKIVDEGLRTAIYKNLQAIQQDSSNNLEALHNVATSAYEQIKALQDSALKVSKNSNDDLSDKFESVQKNVDELKGTLELLTTENYQEILKTEESLLSVLTAMNGELNKLCDIQKYL